MADDNELLKKLQQQIDSLETDKKGAESEQLLDEAIADAQKREQLLAQMLTSASAGGIMAELISKIKGHNWYEGLQPTSPNSLTSPPQTWQRPGPLEFDRFYGRSGGGGPGSKTGQTSDTVTPKGGFGAPSGGGQTPVPGTPSSGGTTTATKRPSPDQPSQTTITPPGGTTTAAKTFPYGGISKAVTPPAAFSTVPPPPQQEWKSITEKDQQISVQSGQRYKAKTNLGMLESFASNDRITEEFKKMGFKDVAVSGSGRERIVEGTWGGSTSNIPTDKRISEIQRQEITQQAAKPIPSKLEILKPALAPLRMDRPPEHKTGPSAISRPTIIQETGPQLQQQQQKTAPQTTSDQPTGETITPGRIVELQQEKAETRKGKISQTLRRQLEYASSRTGLTFNVISGGQRMKGAPGATGSHRHDYGNAADGYLTDENGHRLDVNNQQDQKRIQEFMKHSVAAGATGIGGGNGYMKNKHIHIGGGQPEAYWGSPKASSEGAPSWVKNAWNEGRSSQAEYKNYQSGLPTKPSISATIKGGKGDFGGGGTSSWEQSQSQTYSDPKGFKVDSYVPSGNQLPAGMRNQNPGNIKYNSNVPWEGLVGPSQNTDQGDPQAVFKTHQHGMNAAARLAYNKYTRRGLKSIDDIIAGPGGWTAGTGTEHEAARNIAKHMGIDVNADAQLDKPENMTKFLKAMVIQEHGPSGKAYTQEMFDIAAKRATGTTGTTKISDSKAPEITDISAKAGLFTSGKFEKVEGLVVHHTAGRDSIPVTIDKWKKADKTGGVSAHYIMDRDGKIYQTLPSGAKGAHVSTEHLKQEQFSNQNLIGIEVIAKNDKDWTNAQKEAILPFMKQQQQIHGFDPSHVWGHGELNPGHREKTEGMQGIEQWRKLQASEPTSKEKPSLTVTSQDKTQYGIGVQDNKRGALTREELANRPIHSIGEMTVMVPGAEKPEVFRAGSGGFSNSPGVPPGQYELTWQARAQGITDYYKKTGIPTTRNDAFGSVFNVGVPGVGKTTIPGDPLKQKLFGDEDRQAIQIHAGSDLQNLKSAGCLVVDFQKDFPRLEEATRKIMAANGGKATLIVNYDKNTKTTNYQITAPNAQIQTITANEAIRNKQETGAIDRKPTPEQTQEHSAAKKEITDRLVTLPQKETGTKAITVEADESGKPKITSTAKVETKPSSSSQAFIKAAKEKETKAEPVKEAKAEPEHAPKQDRSVFREYHKRVQENAVRHNAIQTRNQAHEQPAPPPQHSEVKHPGTMSKFVQHRQEKRNINQSHNWISPHTNPSAAASSRVENAYKTKTGRDDSFSTAGQANA